MKFLSYVGIVKSPTAASLEQECGLKLIRKFISQIKIFSKQGKVVAKEISFNCLGELMPKFFTSQMTAVDDDDVWKARVEV